MASEISIKVNIGDRVYPLKINAIEEEYHWKMLLENKHVKMMEFVVLILDLQVQ